jgi:hypothetical protein
VAFDVSIKFASLHHKVDLVCKLCETARVLKRVAPLVAIDRAHIDDFLDVELGFMLECRCSATWKA